MVQNQKGDGDTCSLDIYSLIQITFPFSCRAHILDIQLWKHFGNSEGFSFDVSSNKDASFAGVTWHMFNEITFTLELKETEKERIFAFSGLLKQIILRNEI